MATIADIAKKYGVSRTAVSAWLSKGCPHTMVQKYQLRPPVVNMDEASVEEWLDAYRAQNMIQTAARKGGEA